jgi:hypothetical protein
MINRFSNERGKAKTFAGSTLIIHVFLRFYLSGRDKNLKEIKKGFCSLCIVKQLITVNLTLIFSCKNA